MNKLLGLTMSALLVSSVAMAQDAKPETPNDMPPPPMGDEFNPGGRKHFSEADKAKFEEKMKERKAEIAKRLNLTPEQQEKAEALQEKNKEAMKPIMDEMKALREKADALREESKKEFEALLTDEQKETLKTMHKERMEQKKTGSRKKMKFNKHHERNRAQSVPQDKAD